MSTNCHHYSDESCSGCSEPSPGTCPSCGTDRQVCGDCGRWLACEGTCDSPADCTCEAEAVVEAADDEEDEETEVIEMRCEHGHVSCFNENVCRQSRESRFAIVESEAA